jgi:hypothetical protein
VLGPIHEAFSALIESIRLGKIMSLKKIEPKATLSSLAGDDFPKQLQRLIDAAGEHVGWEVTSETLFKKIEQSFLDVIQVLTWNQKASDIVIQELVLKLYQTISKNKGYSAMLPVWALTRYLGILASEEQADQISRSWLDEWLLARLTGKMLREMEIEESNIDSALGLLKVLVAHQSIFNEQKENDAIFILNTLLADPEIHQFLQVNRYQGVLWFNQERYELLLAGLTSICLTGATGSNQDLVVLVEKGLDVIDVLFRAGATSGHQLEKLINAVRK